MTREPCIRCCDQPAVDDFGYCGHCHWAVQAEVEQGFSDLRGYLAGWWRFEEWCSQHDQVAVW